MGQDYGKENAAESFEKYRRWWNRKGLLVSSAPPLYRESPSRPQPKDEEKYIKPEIGLQWLKEERERLDCPADVLPLANVNIGPGSLAIFLGAEPKTQGNSVWFHTPYTSRDAIPEFRWDDDNIWWQRTKTFFRGIQKELGERFILPFPDLCENIDVLASLRGSEELMMDMIDDPQWVKAKLEELDAFNRQALRRFAELIRAPDGSTGYYAFRLWGDGLTIKQQCDASAMISPAMFDDFVIPSLADEARLADHSLYHLDGTQCIPHLDSVLQIGEIDAVEWTPQAGLEPGDHARWRPMYRKILDAGKSVQILIEEWKNAKELLHDIGTDGVFLLSLLDRDDFYRMLDDIGQYL